MDDALPRLIGLLLAAAVVMVGLRAQLGDTPQGRRLFRVVLVAFLAVIAFAVWALLRGGEGTVPAIPEGPTTVAGVDVPGAPES